MADLTGTRVMVTGGGGFLGKRIVSLLDERGAESVVVRAADYDLRDPAQVRRCLDEVAPQMIVHAAAVVGGIGANRRHPGQFFYENAVMGLHLLHESYVRRVAKVAIVGTVCSYPKFTPVPFKESSLWDGYPEETNAPYGLAKKMLLAQAQAYRAEYGFNAVYVIPTNLYGPGDNFHPDTSHVIPAMLLKCLEAKRSGRDEVELWGSGTASREFLYVDDAARGIVMALERYDDAEPLNLGSGEEVTIRDLAEKIKEVTGYGGGFRWDTSQPDGQPRRSIDWSRARDLLGWEPRVDLAEGLRRTLAWCKENEALLSAVGA